MELIFSPLGAAVLVGLAVLSFAFMLRPARQVESLEDRMEAFLSREQERSGAIDEVQGSFIQRVVLPAGQRFIQTLGRLAPAKATEEINLQLIVAGRPGNLGPLDFLGLRILLAIVGLGLGFLNSRNVANPTFRLLGPAMGLAFGYMLPSYWLKSQVRRRKDIIQRALPDALDMLTVCVEAGLAFESALQRVSTQWKGALSEEFGRVVAEIRLGVPRPQALRRFSQRCDVPDVASFVAVLVQADSMGTSIANVLHSQADQMRVLRRQRAEEKANQAPIKVVMAMMIFIFPALFIVILGPAVPALMNTFGAMGAK
jgi:tight adherence protein C